MSRTQTSLLALVLCGFVSSVSGQTAAPTAATEMKAYAETLAGTPHAIEMLPIPVGTPGYPATFTLGSRPDEPGRNADEGPPVEIRVAPFWMGRLEITWDVYDEFRKQYALHAGGGLVKGRGTAASWVDAVSIPTPLWEQDAAPILDGLGTRGGYPVADVSHFAAKQFTKWLSRKTGRFYRLPTEAEWEYAARAGTTTPYFFGADAEKLGDYAWTFDTSAYDDPEKGYPGAGAGYRQVGLKKANPWGLHDILGNVSEWVVDAYAKDAYARLGGKATPFDAAINWPTKVFPCVARGGNWESEPAACRSAARLASHPKWQDRDPQIPQSIWWHTDAFHVGFRVLRPKTVPDAATQERFWGPHAEVIRNVLDEESKQVRITVGADDGGAKK